MSQMIKPCTLAKRHAWTFVRNRICTNINGSSAQISQRGVYRCKCGARKLGEPRINMEPTPPQENDR